jgi:hypothetical protein
MVKSHKKIQRETTNKPDTELNAYRKKPKIGDLFNTAFLNTYGDGYNKKAWFHYLSKRSNQAVCVDTNI